MTVRDPINVTPQQLQEQESLPQIQLALVPWLVQWAQQGGDFGRDGLVQIVDDAPAGGTVSPLTFLIQAKSQREALSEEASVTVETRHLGNWSSGPSCVVLALRSAAGGQIAFRTAREVVAELDRVRPGWKEQATVAVHFRPEHVMFGKTARERIRRSVADEADSLGGLKRFHQARRRVLLTDLYFGTSSTAQTITASAPGRKDDQIVLGPGWQQQELDPTDVFAPRVLAGALLLFEEVLVPLAFLEVAVRSLGTQLLQSLLTAEHLIPVATEDLVGFRHEVGEFRGTPVGIHPHDEEGPFVRRVAERMLVSVNDKRDLLGVIHRITRIIPPNVTARIVKESQNDLAKPAIRNLLGLSPHRTEDGSEPVWDAMLVNRVLHLNTALATAEELNVDVVEYEAGLSRLASEKWYTELRFNRLFDSVEVFDRVLRAAGVPDLGLLESRIGLARIAELAVTQHAQEFRDWFWGWVCGLVDGGANVEAAVIAQLGKVVGEDLRALRLPCELKLRFFDQIRADYMIGPNDHARRHGYAARSDRGAGALQRQAAVQSRRRRETIKDRIGEPVAYGRCPCGSGGQFRFCCGPRRGQ